MPTHLPHIRLSDPATLNTLSRVQKAEGFKSISAAARAMIFRGMVKEAPRSERGRPRKVGT